MQYPSLPCFLFRWACCLALATFVGCGTKAASDPLAGVGGYKLVYQQREKRRVDADAIASALRSRINAKSTDDVVVRALDDGGCEILLPGASEKTVADVKRAVTLSNLFKFRIVAHQSFDKRLIAAAEGGKVSAETDWVTYMPDKVSLPPDSALRTMPDGKGEVLVLEGEEPVDGWHIQSAKVARDESSRPCLHGTLTAEGALRLEKLTSIHRYRQLAIIFDGVLISAPTIQSAISSHVQITGDFTESELKFLVASLKSAHALGSLEPTPDSEIKVVAGNQKQE